MAFASIQDFRERATDKDYKELADFIKKQKNKVDAFKDNQQYHFSYTAAAKELKERGYLHETGRQNFSQRNEDLPRFWIGANKHPDEYVTRSFSLRKDLNKKLKALESDYSMYTKKSIFNRLMEKALEDFGYGDDIDE